MTILEDKVRVLDPVLRAIEEKHGKGAIMKLGDIPDREVDVIPTGFISLDKALGIGGLPKGRIVEIFGPESSGKTTLALHAVASAQASDGLAAFVDSEHALDPVYATALGVDIDNLFISQPDNGEQALDITENLVRSGVVDIIVIDSVAALVPKEELEGDMEDKQIGLQARMMSKAMRKIVGVINGSGTCVVFINQLREKVGVVYGNPEVTTGGKALKFYTSMRIDIRKRQALRTKGATGDIYGNITHFKIIKNKLAPPFKEVFLNILYGRGISKEDDLLDQGVLTDVLDKAGNWFIYKNNKIANGKANAIRALIDDPDLYDTIKADVLKAMKE